MSLYYRRWTRMHFMPALRYFYKYGMLSDQYDIFKPVISRQFAQDLPPKWKKSLTPKLDDLDERLIDKLFLKYPDLKYESLDRASRTSDSSNTFSYAYSFIAQQKRLLDRGYTVDKSFEMVEKRFHDHINRKLDQTLLSRGLAIGNRARSFLTVYQQQMEYESRLKTQRTKRELHKYEQKLKQIKEAIDKPAAQQSEEEIYARMLYKIEEAEIYPENKKPKTEEELRQPSRHELVEDFETNVRSVFEQFYETAATKDRLEGLRDQEILDQIMDAPSKIKNRLRELLKKLHKHGVQLTEIGDIDYSKVKNPRIKKLFMDNPSVRVALLTEAIDFETPHKEHMKDQARKINQRLRQLEEEQREYALTDEQKDRMLKNMKTAYTPYQSAELREETTTYKIFESPEERLLRLEIKWLRNKLADIEGSIESSSRDEYQNSLKKAIDKLRRLKHRIEQKNLAHVYSDTQVIFDQHRTIQEEVILDSKVEYEQLLHYLRKKVEERRLSTFEEINDDKINELIKRVGIQEDPTPEGFKRLDKDPK